MRLRRFRVIAIVIIITILLIGVFFLDSADSINQIIGLFLIVCVLQLDILILKPIAFLNYKLIVGRNLYLLQRNLTRVVLDRNIHDHTLVNNSRTRTLRRVLTQPVNLLVKA